jgi:hypothetical protein
MTLSDLARELNVTVSKLSTLMEFLNDGKKYHQNSFLNEEAASRLRRMVASVRKEVNPEVKKPNQVQPPIAKTAAPAPDSTPVRAQPVSSSAQPTVVPLTGKKGPSNSVSTPAAPQPTSTSISIPAYRRIYRPGDKFVMQYDKVRLLCAVAQLPGGPKGNLVSLAPVCTLDGQPVQPWDFPSPGLVFWEINDEDRYLNPHPGMLLVARLSAGSLPNNDFSMLYHVEKGEVDTPKAEEVIEIVFSPDDLSADPALLFASHPVVSLDHPPCPNLILSSPTRAYGNITPAAAEGRFSGSFSLAEPAGSVLEFASLPADLVREFEVVVSQERTLRQRANSVKPIVYALVVGPSIEALRPAGREIVVRSPEMVLRPVLERFDQAARFEEFRPLFQALQSSQPSLLPEASEILDKIRVAAETNKKVVHELAGLILDAGVMKDALEKRTQESIDAFVEKRRAEIEGRLDESLQAKHEQLGQLEGLAQNLTAALEQRRLEFEDELNASSQVRQSEFETAGKLLDERERQIETREGEARRRLENVVNRWNDERGRVLEDYLALAPLLPGAPAPASVAQPSRSAPAGEDSTSLNFPPAVYRRPGEVFQPLPEAEFFERFRRHVRHRRFEFRDLDLIAFHQSFKCSDFMVLGGLSGTGKTSLPQLYMEALLGDRQENRFRFQEIPVNPTWMEMEDLLGRVNVLERRYNPSRSGLARWLIYAHQEYAEKKDLSGVYSLTLDEMNLAQVEYYFVDILRYLGAAPGDIAGTPTLKLFDPSLVGPNCVFQAWPNVMLSPALRFVGTVNYDETTRRLSARVLDRAPEIRIVPPAAGPDLGIPEAPDGALSGPEVTLRHMREWSKAGPVLPEHRHFLSAIERLLEKLGCPITPRRRKVIDTALGSFHPEILEGCSPHLALDLVVSQRLLPLLRGLFRRGAPDTLRSLGELIAKPGLDLDLDESERVFEEIALENADSF